MECQLGCAVHVSSAQRPCDDGVMTEGHDRIQQQAPAQLRVATEADYAAVASAIQSWWTLPGLDTAAAARERAALVPRLWLQHFANTSCGIPRVTFVRAIAAAR
jgi:hypothetical protein